MTFLIHYDFVCHLEKTKYIIVIFNCRKYTIVSPPPVKFYILKIINNEFKNK